MGIGMIPIVMNETCYFFNLHDQNYKIFPDDIFLSGLESNIDMIETLTKLPGGKKSSGTHRLIFSL